MDYKEKNINLLKGVSDYFENQKKANGSIFCYKDRVEHTGKNTYSIIIDTVLFQKTNDEKYFKRALERARRAVDNLIYIKEDDCYIFYPGSKNNRNASNSIIDGGAIIDSLSLFLKNFADKLESQDYQKIKDVILKHCNTYLKKYVVEKQITNQRLWGATGLASAYNIFAERSDWHDAVTASIKKSFSEQNKDGSFPYHPNYKEINGHPGMADISPYYHSRHIAFILHSLEMINDDVEDYLESLIRATDVLLAMYEPRGVKNMFLEGKRWYWNSEYEVASNPYDIYVFTRMYEITGNKNYFIYADRALNILLEHQLKDGGITSNKGGGDNWQCRIVWNSHIAWFAKVIDKILPNEENEAPDFFYKFDDAGIIKKENKNYCFILRYKKKPMNIDWGSYVGGGNLLYYGKKEEGWKNISPLSLLKIKPTWQSCRKVTNLIKYGKNNLKKFIKDNSGALLGERWRIYVYVTSGNIIGAINRLWREVINKYLGYDNEYSDIWATDSELLEFSDKEIKIKINFAKRDGTILEGKEIIKEYSIHDDYLEIK